MRSTALHAVLLFETHAPFRGMVGGRSPFRVRQSHTLKEREREIGGHSTPTCHQPKNKVKIKIKVKVKIKIKVKTISGARVAKRAY